MEALKKKVIEILESYAVSETNDTGRTGEQIIYTGAGTLNDVADDVLAALKEGGAFNTLYVTDTPIGELLERFWQRSSDACPLECGEAEKQESEFKEWAESISWVIVNLTAKR